MCSCGGSRRSGLAPNNPEPKNLLRQSYQQQNRNPVISYQLPKIVAQRVVTMPVISHAPVVVQLLQSNRPVHSGNLPGLRRK
jgi:hypothetical protein